MRYHPRKAAQVAAFFVLREVGAIHALKLSNLLYLADREHLNRHDMPILFDIFVSMPHGPVTSLTLNYIGGMENDPGWMRIHREPRRISCRRRRGS